MRNWSDRFRDGGGAGTDFRSGFNVELSFRLEDQDSLTRRRRTLLVCEALKAIQHRDERLITWKLHSEPEDDWVLISAVVVARQPGEVAQLSEEWMRSAIAAANLAAEPAAVRVPKQREGWSSIKSDDAGPKLPDITAQVWAGAY